VVCNSLTRDRPVHQHMLECWQSGTGEQKLHTLMTLHVQPLRNQSSEFQTFQSLRQAPSVAGISIHPPVTTRRCAGGSRACPTLAAQQSAAIAAGPPPSPPPPRRLPPPMRKPTRRRKPTRKPRHRPTRKPKHPIRPHRPTKRSAASRPTKVRPGRILQMRMHELFRQPSESTRLSPRS